MGVFYHVGPHDFVGFLEVSLFKTIRTGVHSLGRWSFGLGAETACDWSTFQLGLCGANLAP